MSSTLPFRDRVVLVNFVCGDLAHEYSVTTNYHTSKVLAPFIGSEISLRDFLSISKKSVFWWRVGAVLLANFVCGDLVHEYSVPINCYTPESPKI